MALVPSSSHTGGLGNVTLSGTAAAGQAPIASSSSAAAWAYPPGYELDYAQITANVTVSATTEGSPTTIVTGNAVTYDGSTIVLVEFYSGAVTVVASAELFIGLYQDGTSIGWLSDQTDSASGNMAFVVRSARRITPSAGSHTYSIRGWRATSNCIVQAGAGGSGALMPAFMRITKVA